MDGEASFMRGGWQERTLAKRHNVAIMSADRKFPKRYRLCRVSL